MSKSTEGQLEEMEGAAVAWTSPEGIRTEYWPGGIKTVHFEVRELRSVVDIDRFSSGNSLDKPVRRQFCGKASIDLGVSLELIGHPDTRSSDVSVSFLEGTEGLERLSAEHRGPFDASRPVLISYYPDSGWEMLIPLSSSQFQSLSEAFDKGKIESIWAGVSSFRLFATSRYYPEDESRLYLAPGAFKASAPTPETPAAESILITPFKAPELSIKSEIPRPKLHFEASNDGSGSIWGSFERFGIASKLEHYSPSLDAQRPAGAKHIWNLPSTLQEAIRREVSSRFGPLEDADRIADTNRQKVWVTMHLAYDIAIRTAGYRTRPDEEFNSQLTVALDYLKQVQKSLNILSNETWTGSQWAKNLRGRLTEFEKECDPKSWVWLRSDLKSEIEARERVHENWIINSESLTEQAFIYLNNPEIDYPKIEFIMTDALIFEYALEFGVGLKEKSAWITPVSLGCVGLGLAVAYFFGPWLGMLLGTLCVSLAQSYWYFHMRKSVKLLREMISVSNLFLDKRVSPAFIKNRLLATADRGAVWPTGAIALVEHAARRNPVTWVI